jgi:hypothetical protein
MNFPEFSCAWERRVCATIQTKEFFFMEFSEQVIVPADSSGSVQQSRPKNFWNNCVSGKGGSVQQFRPKEFGLMNFLNFLNWNYDFERYCT